MTEDKGILIKNIYYMLTYAFQVLRQTNYEEIEAEQFDEIQDLAGDDIEILRLLIDSKIDIICCGDNKQATFCTHNTKKNKRKTGKNIWEFFKEFGDRGLIEVERNLVSRRFNDQICCFANAVFPIGNPISTNMKEVTGHDGVFLISAENVDVYYKAFTPQMLRYDKRAETYGYLAVNYGACKGDHVLRSRCTGEISCNGTR